MSGDAVPGCRVKVRFSGRDVNGFVVERVGESEHLGTLSPLRRVVSNEPVLTPQVLRSARLVADRYAGTLADVLRLAVPPRHARVEATPDPARVAALDVDPEAIAAAWADEPGGRAWTHRLAVGEHPRAVWTAPPGSAWAERLAASAAACRQSGRGSLLLAPDARALATLHDAVGRLLGADSHVVLSADLGPAARYRAFLAVSRGLVDIVVGTRAAAFAPVHRLGLLAIWDDGDDSYAEPRSPYPHAREVLALRAYAEGSALLVGGVSRSVEAQAMLESGWAGELAAPRDLVRLRAPQVHVTGESDTELARDPVGQATRMPGQVFSTVRAALAEGPVLVHTPRGGYQPALTCERCRRVAPCARCSGTLARAHRGAAPVCRRCGTEATDWTCPTCGAHALRAPVSGARRSAEEWGRAFPGTTVVTSGGDHVVARVGPGAAIVIATPGAEPEATDGYAAAVVMDTWLTLALPGLRANEEALRRWLQVATLVRPGAAGGRVVAVGDPAHPALQALVRWDPAGFASRELADRRSARLTPAARLATLTAAPDVLAAVMTDLELPRGADLLGPVPVDDETQRLVLRIAIERGAALSRELQRLQAGRSSRKLTPVRVQVDPVELA